MIEIHNVLTANKTQAIFRRLQNNTLSTGQQIVVSYNTDKGVLENGMLGVVEKCRISTSQLSAPPTSSDEIEIQGRKYRFINIALKKHPVFVPYYKCEIKSKN